MADSPILPGSHSRPLAGDGGWTREWYRYFGSLQTYVTATTGNTTDLTALSASVTAIDDRVTTLEGVQAAVITGPQSVEVGGSLGAGAVSLRLRGDSQAPGNTKYYGTGPTGAKGWFSHAVSTLADVDLTALAADDVLRYNGTAWVRQPVSDDAALLLADADVPRLGTINTWALAQTFTVAPVFTDAAGTRTALGATTVGSSLFTAANPSAVRWIRVNADNSVTFRTAAETLSDIGAQAAGSYQPLDATLTALAAQNWAANAFPIGTGADTLSQVSFAANTFPARASAGDLVAKTITDSALTFAAGASVVTAGLVNQQSYRVTDLNVAFGSFPGAVSIATGGTNAPASTGNYAGLHIPFDATSVAQIAVRSNADNPRLFFRGSDTSTFGSWKEAARRGNAVTTATTSASITPNVDNFDVFERSAQTVAFAVNAPSGTPQDGQRIRFRMKDNGTGRALTWNAAFVGTFVALPATTIANKWMIVEFEYNAIDAVWQCIRVLNQL
jgi:hypothetical protein